MEANRSGRRFPFRRVAVLILMAGISPALAADPPAMPQPLAPQAAPAAVPAPDAFVPPNPLGNVQCLPIDLPSVLRLVNASNPTIAVAQARVEESYYLMREAQVAWLPNLRAGPAYERLDGEVQNAIGNVFTTSKSYFFQGGAAFATWDTSNIYFGPLIARRLYQAQMAFAQAVTNDMQLDAVLTYLDLVRVYSALAINVDTLARAEEMLRLSQRAEKEGLGLPWMVSRALTEVEARRTERTELLGEAAATSARLVQLLLLEPTVQLQPAAPPVVPITLIPEDSPLEKLIALGLDNRPEMRQSRFLTDAARTSWQQARVTPFVPKLSVGYTAGVFGGGRDSDMSNFSGRGDGTAMAVWELQNLGAGNMAQIRARRAALEAASYHITEIQAQVSAEVVEAARVSVTRRAALDTAQDGVRQGIEMWSRLVRYIVNVGMPARTYNPLELLIAEQQLDQARLLYLTQVIGYNKAQFRLYWAIGQPPLCALPEATPIAVEEPVVPPTYQPTTLPQRPAGEVLPQPRPADKKE